MDAHGDTAALTEQERAEIARVREELGEPTKFSVPGSQKQEAKRKGRFPGPKASIKNGRLEPDRS